MKKEHVPKLKLTRETLRDLEGPNLGQAKDLEAADLSGVVLLRYN
jgi:hypothetical protein